MASRSKEQDQASPVEGDGDALSAEDVMREEGQRLLGYNSGYYTGIGGGLTSHVGMSAEVKEEVREVIKKQVASVLAKLGVSEPGERQAPAQGLDPEAPASTDQLDEGTGQ